MAVISAQSRCQHVTLSMKTQLPTKIHVIYIVTINASSHTWIVHASCNLYEALVPGTRVGMIGFVAHRDKYSSMTYFMVAADIKYLLVRKVVLRGADHQMNHRPDRTVGLNDGDGFKIGCPACFLCYVGVPRSRVGCRYRHDQRQNGLLICAARMKNTVIVLAVWLRV